MAERINNSEIWDIPETEITRRVDEFSADVNDGSRLELYLRKEGSKGPILPAGRRSFVAMATGRDFPVFAERPFVPREQNIPEAFL